MERPLKSVNLRMQGMRNGETFEECQLAKAENEKSNRMSNPLPVHFGHPEAH